MINFFRKLSRETTNEQSKRTEEAFCQRHTRFFPFSVRAFFTLSRLSVFQAFRVVRPMEKMERIYGPFLCFCQGQVFCERESFRRNTLIEAKRRRIENLSALQTTSRLILQLVSKRSIMILLNDLFVLFQPKVLLCHKFSILSLLLPRPTT